MQDRCVGFERGGWDARSARTRTHNATPKLGPPAADPAARLLRALIELIDGERPLGAQEQQVAPPP